MSRSFRGDKAGPWIIGGAIAYALVLFVSIAAIYSYVDQRVYNERTISKKTTERYRNFRDKCSNVLSVEELRSCYKNHIDTGWKTERDQQDLNAQQQMAEWAFLMLIVTAVIGSLSLIMTGVGIVLVYLNLKEARIITVQSIRSADAAQNVVDETRIVGRRQVRAYLSGESATYTTEPNYFTCFLIIKNFGQSPAKKVKVTASVSWNLPPPKK